MLNRNCPRQNGQAKIEYALLIVLVALAAIVVLALLGPQLSDLYQSVASQFMSIEDDDEPSPVVSLTQDFLSRILDYRAENGRWPRSWGDYRFTDIGLNPADWTGPVEGVFWNPNGDKIGLANKPGDNLQIYVDDLNGNTLKLYDGWNIWCLAETGQCYYHTVAPGNEIDLNTLTVVEG